MYTVKLWTEDGVPHKRRILDTGWGNCLAYYGNASCTAYL